LQKSPYATRRCANRALARRRWVRITGKWRNDAGGRKGNSRKDDGAQSATAVGENEKGDQAWIRTFGAIETHMSREKKSNEKKKEERDNLKHVRSNEYEKDHRLEPCFFIKQASQKQGKPHSAASEKTFSLNRKSGMKKRSKKVQSRCGEISGLKNSNRLRLLRRKFPKEEGGNYISFIRPREGGAR